MHSKIQQLKETLNLTKNNPMIQENQTKTTTMPNSRHKTNNENNFYKEKRLKDIRDNCFRILYEIDPETAKSLAKELEEKRNKKLKQEEFDAMFKVISDTRKSISNDEYKQKVQTQLDHQLADRLENESLSSEKKNIWSSSVIRPETYPKPKIPLIKNNQQASQHQDLKDDNPYSDLSLEQLMDMVDNENLNLEEMAWCTELICIKMKSRTKKPKKTKGFYSQSNVRMSSSSSFFNINIQSGSAVTRTKIQY